MTNGRSAHLRERRHRARDRADTGEPIEITEAGKTDELSETSDTSKPSKPSEQNKPAETDKTSVKQEQVGTYMYLPQTQKREMDRVYGLLKTQYEYEFDENFEKNRHFFPLVVKCGLEELNGADALAIRERLDSL